MPAPAVQTYVLTDGLELLDHGPRGASSTGRWELSARCLAGTSTIVISERAARELLGLLATALATR
jgi:hypothetical protein